LRRETQDFVGGTWPPPEQSKVAVMARRPIEAIASEWWSRQRPAKRAGWCAVALIVSVAALLVPMTRRTHPALAVAVVAGFGRSRDLLEWRGPRLSGPPGRISPGDIIGTSVVDPWGRPFLMRVDAHGRIGLPYSVGPDGVDAGGAGDDVVAMEDVGPAPDLLVVPDAVKCRPRVSLLLLAAALALHLALAPRPRARSLAVEASLALALATPWFALSGAWLIDVWWVLVGRAWVDEWDAIQWIPLRTAAVGTVGALVFGLALGWRLRRPRVDEPT
jgi:hypothetical protein